GCGRVAVLVPVHGNDRDAIESGDIGHFGGAEKTVDIVYDGRAGLDGLIGNQGLVGIDGDGDVHAGGDERVDDGHDAVELFLDADGFGAGAGAFTTDIDDVGAFGDHRAGMSDGAVEKVVMAAIGKTVGGNVEDAHQPWRRAQG